MLHDNELSCNKRFEQVVKADLKYGIVDFDALGTGKAKKDKEVKQAQEEVSTVGLVLQLTEMIKGMQVQNVMQSQQQLQEFGINPMNNQIQEMKAYLETLDGKRKGAEDELNAIAKAKKMQERQLGETQRALDEKTQELMDLQVRAQQAKNQGYAVNIPQVQDVQTGTEDYGSVPQKRDAGGKFTKRV